MNRRQCRNLGESYYAKLKPNHALGETEHRFRIEVWQQGESVFAHDYSAAGRDVLVRFPVDTLDALFPRLFPET